MPRHVDLDPSARLQLGQVFATFAHDVPSRAQGKEKDDENAGEGELQKEHGQHTPKESYGAAQKLAMWLI